jgi:hypothetical protein
VVVCTKGVGAQRFMFDPNALTIPLVRADVPTHLQLGPEERQVLRATLALAEGNPDALVLVSELSVYAGLSEAQVSRAIALLEVLELLEYTPAGGVFLSERGCLWGPLLEAFSGFSRTGHALLEEAR